MLYAILRHDLLLIARFPLKIIGVAIVLGVAILNMIIAYFYFIAMYKVQAYKKSSQVNSFNNCTSHNQICLAQY